MSIVYFPTFKKVAAMAGALIFLLSVFAFAYVPKVTNHINVRPVESQPAVQETLPLPAETESVSEANINIPILMYHHVGQLPEKADSVRRDLTVPTESFESQVAWLKKQGYQSVLLEDILKHKNGNFQLPSKPVIFTFDDGYEDVFQNAAPILEKYGYRGSFAIITQYVGQTMGSNVYATWPQIAETQTRGHEIVSHTQNHFDGKNPKFTPQYIYENLSGSIADIREHLGFSTKILVYPYGSYTIGYIEQAKKAGFEMGVTVHMGRRVNLQNLMEVPRLRVHGHESMEEFENLFIKKPRP